MNDNSSTIRESTEVPPTEIVAPRDMLGAKLSVSSRVKDALVRTTGVLKRKSKDDLVLADRSMNDVPIRRFALSIGLITAGVLTGLVALVRDFKQLGPQPIGEDTAQSAVEAGDKTVNGGTLPIEATTTARAERLAIDRTSVWGGEARISKAVVAEQQSVDVPVFHEVVYVERHPMDGSAAATSTPIGEGAEIHIPLSEEIINVQKHVVVTDEVAVGKHSVEETEHLSSTLNHEELPSDDAPSAAKPSEYDVP